MAEIGEAAHESPPITTDLSEWYARGGVARALCLLALMVYGFLISLGNRPLFRAGSFQEE